MERVVVVGGGITGLTCAYRLLRTGNGRALDVVVLEASTRAGGKLRTADLLGFPVEDGADSFVVRKPWALELCRDLGLESELVAPAPGTVYVWTRGRLVAYPRSSAFGIPAGIGELLAWPGLRRRARARAVADLLRPPRSHAVDEPLRDLVTRRLGPEAARVLVAPLLAGIHAGDWNRLSVDATFPELATWERGHGSVIRGAKASVKAARRAAEEKGEDTAGPLFATVWTGLARIVEMLARAVGPERLRLGEPVAALERRGAAWRVRTASSRYDADAVVLATPAFESARLLSAVAGEAAAQLAGIPYASTAVVTLAYPKGTVAALPSGTGFIVPPGSEVRTITACTFVSHKWPREEHEGRAVVRCFVGRFGDEGPLEAPDDRLAAAAAADVRTATGIPDDPVGSRVVRWVRSMPQYEVGHLDRVASIEAALERVRGVFVAGSAYGGVGIADCVRQGTEAATRARRHLAAAGRPPRGIHEEARS